MHEPRSELTGRRNFPKSSFGTPRGSFGRFFRDTHCLIDGSYSGEVILGSKVVREIVRDIHCLDTPVFAC